MFCGLLLSFRSYNLIWLPDLIYRYRLFSTSFSHSVDDVVSSSIPILISLFIFILFGSHSETNGQLLLVQDGKLYGRDPMFTVICRAAAVPEITNNLDLQKNESFVHLGQVKIVIFP